MRCRSHGRALDDNGDLAGGLMGWTWATCARIELLWVHEDRRAKDLAGS